MLILKSCLLLARREREKRQKSGAFDGFGEHALMISASARTPAVLDFSLRILRLSQEVRILVINDFDVGGAKKALLLFPASCWASGDWHSC